MLTPEHQERINSSVLFPIEKTSAQFGLDWLREKMSGLDDRRKQFADLRQENPTLQNFITSMSSARKQLGNHHVSLFKGYLNGSVFMLNTLKDQYMRKGKLFICPTSTQLDLYINDLFEVEYNNERLERIKISSKNQASDFPLLHQVINNLNSTEGIILKQTFAANSNRKSIELFENEPLVKEVITNNHVIKTFGSLDGLKFGALDMYEVFKLREESSFLNRMWNVKIK